MFFVVFVRIFDTSKFFYFNNLSVTYCLQLKLDFFMWATWCLNRENGTPFLFQSIFAISTPVFLCLTVLRTEKNPGELYLFDFDNI